MQAVGNPWYSAHMMLRTISVAVVGALAFAIVGCDGTLDITIETPPDALHFEISDQDIALPAELTGGATIASVPCNGMLMCPPPLGDQSFVCIDSVCDPDALVIVLPVGDVIDFEQLNSELSQIAGNIEAIHIDFVRYNVTQSDLNVSLEPVDLSWGPATASGLSSPGIAPFGRLSQFSAGMHDVDLNEQGISALSDFLVNTSRQIRLFARTSVDLAPGQALPMGAVVTDLQLAITVTGRVL